METRKNPKALLLMVKRNQSNTAKLPSSNGKKMQHQNRFFYKHKGSEEIVVRKLKRKLTSKGNKRKIRNQMARVLYIVL